MGRAKCPRVGSRLKFAANPASVMLYSRPVPMTGEVGTVVGVPLPGAGRKTCTGSSSQDLVYVDWPSIGVMGVARADTVKAKGKGAKQMQVNGGVRTSPDRFYKSDMLMLINNERRHQNVFSYESAKALYDVRQDRETGELRFYKNNRPSEREAHHNIILKHFGLGGSTSVQQSQDDLIAGRRKWWDSVEAKYQLALTHPRVKALMAQGKKEEAQLEAHRIALQITNVDLGNMGDVTTQFSIGQRVTTPHGEGEIRSASGQHVSVYLDNGSYTQLEKSQVRPTGQRQNFFSGEYALSPEGVVKGR